MDSGRETPVKLYYRIGEVADIVGVEPHVLRYWETEFRSIRPQKSRKGQRIYSRRDVDKLLRVKDLLYNQGFTIAGARKRMREPGASLEAQPTEQVSSEAAVPLHAAPAPAVAAPELQRVQSMRHALLEVRRDIVAFLAELDRCSS